MVAGHSKDCALIFLTRRTVPRVQHHMNSRTITYAEFIGRDISDTGNAWEHIGPVTIYEAGELDARGRLKGGAWFMANDRPQYVATRDGKSFGIQREARDSLKATTKAMGLARG